MISTRFRKMTAIAGLSLALMAPAGHAFAAGGQTPHGPDGKTAPTTVPTPPRGPGDITSPLPGGDPIPCNPVLASCDLTSGGSGPDKPTNPTDPGDPGQSTNSPTPSAAPAAVDQAIPAHPTFTG
ncbi:MAG TPA: hypothetical protein VHA73_12535 [Acidimicrobiales bacterium]|jgi:hypothetical protein|nr:hypothetical protein [Acidimicrobiales bacterium]